MKNYKVRIATNSHIHIYKKFENNSRISQVIILTRQSGNKAFVELNVDNVYIDQELLDTMQIALNRARKDARIIKWEEYSIID